MQLLKRNVLIKYSEICDKALNRCVCSVCMHACMYVYCELRINYLNFLITVKSIF